MGIPVFQVKQEPQDLKDLEEFQDFEDQLVPPDSPEPMDDKEIVDLRDVV